MSSTRQLAAIMFTDIVGYTELMGRDETNAMNILSKNRELQKPIVENHRGRWIKEMGDGVIVSFNTATDAVNAAIKIQEKSNSSKDFQLRIGIHLAEVVFENNDVFGDGVNIASRIQSTAKPGSIFISGKVYDEIKNQKSIQTFPLGKFTLKNVKDKLDIFAITNPGINIVDLSEYVNTDEKCDAKCVLVLPFLNISNDPEQEYFSDGLTEELILSLSRLKNIRVISRTTSMQYKNTTKDIRTIGKETGSSYVVEGSVRKHGNNLRITAQFIDAILDVHLWAENFNGSLDDIFEIQEKVSTKIVDALRVKLTNDERETLRKRYTENTEAYQLYLKGRFFWKKRNEESLKTAIRFFEKAIELDANYALAYAGLADSYSLIGEYSNISRREILPNILKSVNKALEIDNQLAEAHISLAVSRMLNEWDWINAEKEFKLGIELSPNYATGHHWYGELLLFRGRITEAFYEINIAVDLDPVSPGIIKDKGIFYYYNRQYDDAIDMAMKALELDANFVPAYRLLSLSYAGKGMFDKAIEENIRWGTLTGNVVKTKVALAELLAVAGKKEEAIKLVKEIEENKIFSGNDYRGIALIYVALGDVEKTFEWLEKSYQMHEESLCSLNVDPKWDLIRPDPRFNRLIKKLGIID